VCSRGCVAGNWHVPGGGGGRHATAGGGGVLLAWQRASHPVARWTRRALACGGELQLLVKGEGCRAGARRALMAAKQLCVVRGQLLV
jgi:hypothetical protein